MRPAANEQRNAVKAEPIALYSDGDSASAFQTIASACIRHFRLNEVLLLESGSAEALHQARVGLRRLRSAFLLCKPLLIADDRARLLRAELKWLAAELGQVRNLDVMIPRFNGKIRNQLISARASMFEHVRGELASTRTRLMMIDLTEWLAMGDWLTRPTEAGIRNVSSFAGELLSARRKRVKRIGKNLISMDDERRHKLRIEVKRLRYATEFFGSLYNSEKAKRRHADFSKALEALQDLLGELNDLVTMPHVLATLGIQGDLPKVGKHKRAELLERAESAFDALVDMKRFWRA